MLISHKSFYTLPTPVFSYTKPSTGAHFILHIMLSMGKFDTEIDLTLCENLRESLRYAQLIGPSNEPNDLERYSNNLMLKYFKEQIVTFPNSKYVLQSWIVQAAELFDSVIVDNQLTISDLPAVQQSVLFNEIDEKNKAFLDKVKSNVIDAAFKELGESTIEQCNIPSKNDLMNASKSHPLEWDPVTNYAQNEGQPPQSFDEQKTAIECCKAAVDKYIDFTDYFVKCNGIQGAAGSGKTWAIIYASVYAISQGLNVITTSHMSRRAIQLGGKHIAFLFGIPYSRGRYTPQRQAELALHKIQRNAVLYNFLRNLDCLVIDEFATSSSETLGVLDIILKRTRDSNTFMGGLLIFFTLDHLQTQPIKERPLLTSPQIIPCFQMVNLKTSVRAATDINFQRIQEIARMPLSELQDDTNDYVNEFLNLVSKYCTFVSDWNAEEINERTYCLYSKKVPAKKAVKEYLKE